MRTLVVGGSGMIGRHIVDHLVEAGHDVTVGANSGADAVRERGLLVLEGDYTAGGLSVDELRGFDAVVFAAGRDVRHLRRGDDEAEFWRVNQIEGVPAIARRAREAGIECFVQIGSYYHQVRPDLVETVPYVRARKLADEGARAETAPGFRAITLNPPSIIGVAPGVTAQRFHGMVAWAAGERPDLPLTAPPGGTNYMSARSLAQAVGGAIARGEGGAAYLVGDENLSYRDYLQQLVVAAGGEGTVVEVDEEHPFLRDRMLVSGRGGTIAYETDAATDALLGYAKGDVTPALRRLVDTVRAETA